MENSIAIATLDKCIFWALLVKLTQNSYFIIIPFSRHVDTEWIDHYSSYNNSQSLSMLILIAKFVAAVTRDTIKSYFGLYLSN